MIFDKTGWVNEDLFIAGFAFSPSYVIMAEKPAVFESGYNCMGRVYEDDIRSTLKGKTPEFLFLTHMHFDHCGSTAYLKKVFPGLKVAASQKAAEIIRRPNALKLIGSLSEGVIPSLVSMMQGGGDERLIMEPFEPFEIDMVLHDGQTIPLGNGLSVQVIAAPGHTRDMLSYYLPEKRILISTEAAGCLDWNGHVVTEFLTDYDSYLNSLRRLMSLDVEVLCQGHRFVFIGDDVGKFLGKSLEAAELFREEVEHVLVEEHNSIEKALIRIKKREYDMNPGPKQPERSYLLNLRTRIEHIAGRMKH